MIAPVNMHRNGLVRAHHIPPVPKRSLRGTQLAFNYQVDLALKYHGLGNMLSEDGDVTAARENYGNAIQLWEHLVQRNPTISRYRFRLASSYFSLANLEWEGKRPDEACNSYLKAIENTEPLLEENSADSLYSMVAMTYHNLANAQFDAQEFDASRRSLRKAIQLQERIVRANPTKADYLEGLAHSYYNLGLSHDVVGEAEAACFWYQRSIGLRERLIAETEPAPAHYRSDLATDYSSLAWLLATRPNKDIRDASRAVEVATKACQLTDWTNPEYLSSLAAAHAEVANFEKAVEWQEIAVQLVSHEEKAEYKRRLNLYRCGKPCRECP